MEEVQRCYIQIISPHLREAHPALDAMLRYETELPIEKMMVDTAGFMELMYALYGLQGFKLSPGIRDLADHCLYPLTSVSDYGALKPLFRGRCWRMTVIRAWLFHVQKEAYFRWHGYLFPSERAAFHIHSGQETMIRAPIPLMMSFANRVLGATHPAGLDCALLGRYAPDFRLPEDGTATAVLLTSTRQALDNKNLIRRGLEEYGRMLSTIDMLTFISDQPHRR